MLRSYVVKLKSYVVMLRSYVVILRGYEGREWAISTWLTYSRHITQYTLSGSSKVINCSSIQTNQTINHYAKEDFFPLIRLSLWFKSGWHLTIYGEGHYNLSCHCVNMVLSLALPFDPESTHMKTLNSAF